ncbi:uncharacterized protein LOC121368246 isoform X2 [Gigantopelta aegis]|uniref:uncharacterized protein LOC121368246 isoform X2 n=1 Tax=Gigantopelta aegis TaxID=1735272 RepID=UPI001B887E85|nr:uncharacterized protein LOC121368246 isoform X2 [Gigantopelta aegis]
MFKCVIFKHLILERLPKDPKRCKCLFKMDRLPIHGRRSLKRPDKVSREADRDTKCSLWKPVNFHVELSYKERVVTVKWDSVSTADVEVGLIAADRPDVFSNYEKILSDSALNSVSFKNFASGTYRALIRPIGCFDCNYADYYGQPCDVNYTSTAPFVFQVQEARVVQKKPGLGEAKSRKATDVDVSMWLVVGMLSVAAFFITSGFVYFAITNYNVKDYKRLPGCDGTFSTMKEIVLIYSKDCDRHFSAVETFIALLKKTGKRVIYPDDRQIISSIRQDVNCIADIPFKNFDCRSEGSSSNLPRCICPNQAKCIMTAESNELEFRCQSPWVENMIEKNNEKFENGPVRK